MPIVTYVTWIGVDIVDKGREEEEGSGTRRGGFELWRWRWA
jgi:hypothetical protein